MSLFAILNLRLQCCLLKGSIESLQQIRKTHVQGLYGSLCQKTHFRKRIPQIKDECHYFELCFQEATTTLSLYLMGCTGSQYCMLREYTEKHCLPKDTRKADCVIDDDGNIFAIMQYDNDKVCRAYLEHSMTSRRELIQIVGRNSSLCVSLLQQFSHFWDWLHFHLPSQQRSQNTERLQADSLPFYLFLEDTFLRLGRVSPQELLLQDIQIEKLIQKPQICESRQVYRVSWAVNM